MSRARRQPPDGAGRAVSAGDAGHAVPADGESRALSADGAGHAVPADGESRALSADGARFSLADRWIRSRLAAMLERVESGFAEYRLDVVAGALYEFTWNEYCDWYLELSKAVLFSDTAGEAEKRGTRHTLIHTLETLLRALHPLAPFISEEIWQRVRRSAAVGGETIMLADFPTPEKHSGGS